MTLISPFQVQAFLSTQESETAIQPETVELLGKGPLPLTTAAINVQAPQTVDEYDSDFSVQSDEENRPLSQEELKQRIMKGISKREGASSARKESRNSPKGDERLSATKKSNKSHRSPLKDR